MIKYLVSLVILLVLALPGAVLAAEGPGVIEGKVVNNTANGSSPAGAELVLRVYRNNAETSQAKTTSNAEGNFVFNGLVTESDYSYDITVTYQKAEYPASERLNFAKDETRKSVELIVYDATSTPDAVKVETSHTIMYLEEGRLWVSEYYLINNDSDRTYIGSKEVAAGTRETLLFSLPAGATGMTPEVGLMECCIYGKEGGFADTMALLPGEKEVIFSYAVSYKDATYNFSKDINYPTGSYNLVVQGQGTTIASDRLVGQPPLTISGSPYVYAIGNNFAPGDRLTAQIAGLPEVSSSSGIVIWALVTLVVLGGGFGVSRTMRKKQRLAPAPVAVAASPEQLRRQLLTELARLDDDFEAGRVPQGAYQKKRAAKKAQLVHVTERLKRKSG